MTVERWKKASQKTGSSSTLRGVLSFVARLLIGLCVSGFFIWLTLRDRDLGEIGGSILEADVAWVLPCIGALLLAHLFRTLRWGILLSPLGRVSFSHLNRASAVGFMALIILPMRLGELGRPWLISQQDPKKPGRPSIRMSSALGTIVFERLFDGVLMTGILLMLLLIGGHEGSEAVWLRRGALLLFVGFFAAALIVWMGRRWKSGTLSLLGRLLRLLPDRAGRWALDVAERMIGGVGGPRAAGSRLIFVLLSVGFWASNSLAIVLLARAFDLQLTPWSALLVLCTQVVAVMIPAGPGMLGTFQYFTILGLSLVLPPELVAAPVVALANVHWACLFGQQVGLGLLLLPRREGVLTRLASGEVEKESSTARDGPPQAPRERRAS